MFYTFTLVSPNQEPLVCLVHCLQARLFSSQTLGVQDEDHNGPVALHFQTERAIHACSLQKQVMPIEFQNAMHFRFPKRGWSDSTCTTGNGVSKG